MFETMFGWIMVGLIAGMVGRLLMPGRDPGGLVVTTLLGMAGALLAGYTARVAGVTATGRLPLLLIAALGAVATLIVYRVVMRARA